MSIIANGRDDARARPVDGRVPNPPENAGGARESRQSGESGRSDSSGEAEMSGGSGHAGGSGEAGRAGGARRRRTSGVAASVAGLLPLYLPRALAGLDDHVRARWLMLGSGDCSVTVLRRASRLQGGLLVFEVRQDTTSVVVKHPRDDHVAGIVAGERRALRALAADARLDPWRPLLPHTPALPRFPLPAQDLVQTRLPGTPAEEFLHGSAQEALRAAAPALALWAELREATGRRRAAGEGAESWSTPLLAALRAALDGPVAARRATGLAALRRRLDAALAGAVLTEGWTHGDYHPGNVLLAGQPPRVTGVFDWGNARPDGPCEIDAYTFALAVRHQLTGRTLGDLVAETLRTGPSDADRALLAPAGLDPYHDLGDPSVLPLLTWLWHVTGNLLKSPRFSRSRGWLAHTVDPVLRECARWAAEEPDPANNP